MSSNLSTFDSDITTMEQAVGLSRMNGGQIELKQSSSGMIAKSFANYCEILEKDERLQQAGYPQGCVLAPGRTHSM